MMYAPLQRLLRARGMLHSWPDAVSPEADSQPKWLKISEPTFGIDKTKGKCPLKIREIVCTNGRIVVLESYSVCGPDQNTSLPSSQASYSPSRFLCLASQVEHGPMTADTSLGRTLAFLGKDCA